MNRFTNNEVGTLKKRLKALRDNVRADKDKSNNAALLEVSTSIPHLHFTACLVDPLRLQNAWPADISPNPECCLMQEARKVGDEFLALEKYVNLNYLVCIFFP